MQGRTVQYITADSTPRSSSVYTAYVLQQRNCHGVATVQVSLAKNDPAPKQLKRTIIHNGASIATFSSGYSIKCSYDPFVVNFVTFN